MAYYVDYHVHSNCSQDGYSTMLDMAKAGIDAGLQEMCFTDHLDEFNWIEGDTPSYDWERLSTQFKEAVDGVGDKIALRLGLEFGPIRPEFARGERLLEQGLPLDFLMASVHNFTEKYNCINIFLVENEPEAVLSDMIDDYLSSVLAMANWGKYSVLGHLTLPVRYWRNQDLTIRLLDEKEEQVREILRKVIDSGCGIEVNTNRGSIPLPHDKWLKIYRQMGGEIITIGSDAHRMGSVGCSVRDGQTLLKDCGFTYFSTFQGGKPTQHKLDTSKNL